MRRLTLVVAVLALALAAGCLGAADETGTSTASTDAGADHRAGGGNATDTGNATDAGNATTYAPGWPARDEADIRPGVRVAGGCTSNFVFSSPDNRTLYLGTAGHCVSDKQAGAQVAVDDGAYTGTLAFARDQDDPFLDFALVEIPEEHRDEVHPAVLHFGGPTGVAADTRPGDRVLTFGNTSLRENPGTDTFDPREGYVTDHDERQTEFNPLPSSVQGDSGSPVLRGDGRAIGLLWGGGVSVEVVGPPCAGCNLAMNLEVAMEAAADAGVPVELKTWDLLADPTLPAGP